MKSADLWDNVVNGRENVVDAIPKIKLERNDTFWVFFYNWKVTGQKSSVNAVFLFNVANISGFSMPEVFYCTRTTQCTYMFHTQALDIKSVTFYHK